MTDQREQTIRNEERVKVREALTEHFDKERRDALKREDGFLDSHPEYPAWAASEAGAAQAFEEAKDHVGAALATLDQEGPCETCGGDGTVEHGPSGATYSVSCDRCGGRGKVVAVPADPSWSGGQGDAILEDCPDCLDKEEEAPVAECEKCVAGEIEVFDEEGRSPIGLKPCPDCTQQVVEEGETGIVLARALIGSVIESDDTGDRLWLAEDLQPAEIVGQLLKARAALDRCPAPQGVSGDGEEAKPKFEAGQRFAGHAFGQAISVTLKEAHLIDPGDDEAPFWVWSIETQLGGGGSLSEEVLASEYEPIPPDPSEVLKARVCAALGVSVPFDTDLEEAVDQLVEETRQILPAATQNQSTDTVPSGGVLGDEETWEIWVCPGCGQRVSGATEDEIEEGVEGLVHACGAGAEVVHVEVVRRDSRLTKEQVREKLADPMHVLASTIGRARVATEPGPIRSDLDDAAKAIGEIRTTFEEEVS